MNKAQRDLVLMVQLQGLYGESRRPCSERHTPPAEVEGLQEANRARQAELDRLERGRADHEAELHEVRKSEEESRLEFEHFQKQKRW